MKLVLGDQGAVTHEDFEGHKGTIGAGDLQWMTAGRGIVHSEMPAAQGTQKGLQLWINLSSKHKMYVYSSCIFIDHGPWICMKGVSRLYDIYL